MIDLPSGKKYPHVVRPPLLNCFLFEPSTFIVNIWSQVSGVPGLV